MEKLTKRLVLLSITFVLFFLYYKFELYKIINFDYLKLNYDILQNYYSNNPLKTILIYFICYILITSFSIPGANILSLFGGALFGFYKGLIVVSFASSFGATFAFLISRYLFRDYIEYKFSNLYQKIKEGMVKDENVYLLSLRLIPIFPFFAINALMGLTRISVLKYYIISQLGMLPGTAVYINAGNGLKSINKLQDVMKLDVLFSLILLGIFPIIIKRLMRKKMS